MPNKLDLSFEVVRPNIDAAQYTKTCSGGRSDCCTRTCNAIEEKDDTSSLGAWEQYLEINEGVLQY